MRWKILDEVKRRLFKKLRVEFSKNASRNTEEYFEFLDKIPYALLDEWKRIEQRYRGRSSINIGRLRGFLYEALFYYACLRVQTFLLNSKFRNGRLWFECIPIFDVKPNPPIRLGGESFNSSPRLEGDFIIVYVKDGSPSLPILVDVKSGRPLTFNWNWRRHVKAAVRSCFIFQISYPKVELPMDLRDWIFKAPCPRCKCLSSSTYKCSCCHSIIHGFKGMDERFNLKYFRDEIYSIASK
ncbi:MAG: hypothetical protein DRJ30_05265 [Candidatus Methanomethylicota archaeon]|nr:MAG: hypothetical protein DRJ30_05265 [Candidatus Verstraetearchaeota archaeon]